MGRKYIVNMNYSCEAQRAQDPTSSLARKPVTQADCALILNELLDLCPILTTVAGGDTPHCQEWKDFADVAGMRWSVMLNGTRLTKSLLIPYGTQKEKLLRILRNTFPFLQKQAFTVSVRGNPLYDLQSLSDYYVNDVFLDVISLNLSIIGGGGKHKKKGKKMTEREAAQILQNFARRNAGNKRNKPKGNRNANRGARSGGRQVSFDEPLAQAAMEAQMVMSKQCNIGLPTGGTKSQKFTGWGRGTMTTGTLGVGYISVSPQITNDTAAIGWSNAATYTGNSVHAPTGTGTGYTSANITNVPYNTAALGVNLQGRPVGCSITLNVVSAELYNSGMIHILMEPEHQTLAGNTGSQLDSYGEVIRLPVIDFKNMGPQTYWINYISNAEGEYGTSTNPYGACPFAVIVDGANTITPNAGVSVDFTVTEEFEYVGETAQYGATANPIFPHGMAGTIQQCMNRMHQHRADNPQNSTAHHKGFAHYVLHKASGGTNTLQSFVKACENGKSFVTDVMAAGAATAGLFA
jgi:hypothetical protein